MLGGGELCAGVVEPMRLQTSALAAWRTWQRVGGRRRRQAAAMTVAAVAAAAAAAAAAAVAAAAARLLEEGLPEWTCLRVSLQDKLDGWQSAHRLRKRSHALRRACSVGEERNVCAVGRRRVHLQPLEACLPRRWAEWRGPLNDTG